MQGIVVGSGSGITDSDLHTACMRHAALTVPALLRTPQGSKPFSRGKITPPASCGNTLEQFVDASKAQLELEEAEEVAQAELELLTYGTAGAQVRH
jgi:hypothetical protein